jgi:hypothetical protein
MAKRTLTSLGTKERIVRAPHAQISFVKNAVQRTELQNTLLGRNIAIRLTGNLIVGVANAANIFAEAPLSLIKSLSVVVDGTVKTIFSGKAEVFAQLQRFERRKFSERTAPIATVGTRPFAATIVLDHEFWRATDPSETLFDPRRWKKVELVVQWGSETDIATAGGGGGTIAIDTANTFIDVFTTSVGVGASGILFDRIIASDQVPVTATQSQLDLKMAQAGLITGIVIRATRDAGAGAGPIPVDDLINKITVLSDVTKKHTDTIKWSTLQSENVSSYQTDGGAAAGLPMPGYVFIDFMENGSLASPINVNALNDTRLRLDVTRTSGTEIIDVMYVFAEPRYSTVQQFAA